MDFLMSVWGWLGKWWVYLSDEYGVWVPYVVLVIIKIGLYTIYTIFKVLIDGLKEDKK